MSAALTARDIVGVFGIVPTPATPDASSWDATDTIDVQATEAMIATAAPGLDAILTLGTFGEGPTVTEDEAVVFTRAVIAANHDAKPVFAGATMLNTRDTISRARRLLDAGATGLLLGRPMWCELDEDSIVRFYSDVAEALPTAPVIVYDNGQAFKGGISTATYERLARIPTLIAAKYTQVGPKYADDVDACGDSLRLMPIDDNWLDAWRIAGERASACWSSSAACGTAPLERLRAAILSGDEWAAEAVAGEIRLAYATHLPHIPGKFPEFSRYNIPLDKARISGAGLVDPGPARAPYSSAPQSYLDGSIEAGRRWGELHRRYVAESSVVGAK